MDVVDEGRPCVGVAEEEGGEALGDEELSVLRVPGEHTGLFQLVEGALAEGEVGEELEIGAAGLLLGAAIF